MYPLAIIILLGVLFYPLVRALVRLSDARDRP